MTSGLVTAKPSFRSIHTEVNSPPAEAGHSSDVSTCHLGGCRRSLYGRVCRRPGRARLRDRSEAELVSARGVWHEDGTAEHRPVHSRSCPVSVRISRLIRLPTQVSQITSAAGNKPAVDGKMYIRADCNESTLSRTWSNTARWNGGLRLFFQGCSSRR